jgi:hypothetical protein
MLPHHVRLVQDRRYEEQRHQDYRRDVLDVLEVHVERADDQGDAEHERKLQHQCHGQQPQPPQVERKRRAHRDNHHQHEQHDERQQIIYEVRQAHRERHEHPREVHFLDEVGVPGDSARRVARAHHHELPEDHARKQHGDRRRHLGQDRDEHVVDQHHQQRVDERPQKPQRRVLVTHLERAHGQVHDELTSLQGGPKVQHERVLLSLWRIA